MKYFHCSTSSPWENFIMDCCVTQCLILFRWSIISLVVMSTSSTWAFPSDTAICFCRADSWIKISHCYSTDEQEHFKQLPFWSCRPSQLQLPHRELQTSVSPDLWFCPEPVILRTKPGKRSLQAAIISITTLLQLELSSTCTYSFSLIVFSMSPILELPSCRQTLHTRVFILFNKNALLL